MLERKRAGVNKLTNKQKVEGKRSVRPGAGDLEDEGENAQSPKGEGGREEEREGEDPAAPGSQVHYLGGPGPNPGPAKRPPGRLALGRGHNYTSAPGKDLKTKWRGLQSGSKALRSSEGVGPVHRNLLQGMWVQGKKKKIKISHFHPAWAVKIKAAF